MSIQDTAAVVHISTNVETGCTHCSEQIGGEDRFAESINHYIQAHGYKLLHVGQQTTPDYDGKPRHATAAVLGRE
jgi:hypothetical protein